nr:[FeFe] hydrogenase H-cluster maturation GTPase HydF [Bacteroidota bacterium]
MSKGRDNKPHIGIFGRRNSGKSSLINVLAGQEIAIVSDIAGTTTDPVKKSIELEGIGPAILVDTAGIDDEGELGQKRIAKTKSVLKVIDLAILIISENQFGDFEDKLVEAFRQYDLPFIIVHNKADVGQLTQELKEIFANKYQTSIIDFSTIRPTNILEVSQALRKHMPENAYMQKSLLGGLVKKGDVALLVTPIDSEAPEGRMILPQVQAIRDVLDNDAIVVALKEDQLEGYLNAMQPKPVLVITDSQVFPLVDTVVPPEISMTSFSIMLSHHKGDFKNYHKGTPHLSKLKDGDRILILESCTHHVSCEDIGRVKIPGWLSRLSDKKLDFDVVAGLDNLPRNIHDYAIVIQCGGCVITRRQIINRLKPAVDAGIPVTNYGMAIAWMHGIFDRAVAPFVDLDEKKNY